MWIETPIVLVGYFVDAIVYQFLESCYVLFKLMAGFNSVALDGLINGMGTTIRNLFAIFMLFRIAIALLQYIADPDKFTEKQSGGAQLVKKVATSIVLLICSNLIFNVLHDVQLLLIGTDGLPAEYAQFKVIDAGSDASIGIIERITIGEAGDNSFGRTFAVTILELFLYDQNGHDPLRWSNSSSDEVLKNISMGDEEKYNFWSILLLVPNSSLGGWVSNTIAYWPIIPEIVGIYLAFQFIKYTIDIAVRTLKLTLLQILFPVPVIANMVPGGDKLFKNYIKLYSTTFGELILRFLTFYIGMGVLTMINDENGLVSTLTAGGSVNWFTTALLKVLFIVGVFRFIKIFPEFIAGLFGTNTQKSDGSLGKFLGGLGGFAIGLGSGAIAAKKAGLSGSKAAFQGFSSGFKGWQQGKEAKSLGAFASGAISNYSASNSAASASADKMSKQRMNSINEASQKRQAIDQSFNEQYESMYGSKSDYIKSNFEAEKNNTIIGATGNRTKDDSEIRKTLSIKYDQDKAVKKQEAINGLGGSNNTNIDLSGAVNDYNKTINSIPNHYGMSEIKDYTSYIDSETQIKNATYTAKTYSSDKKAEKQYKKEQKKGKGGTS